MLGRAIRILSLLVVSLSLLTPLWAVDSYLLETTNSSDVSRLASVYQFTINKSWLDSDHWAYIVTPVAAFSSTQLSALQKESGVLGVETNKTVGAGGEESKSATTTEQITDQFAAKPAVTFYGSTVRASYVDQPVTRIIGLSDALKSYPTGNTIVAIIDTGVDEKHPALKNVLIPGYDFTRDQAGTASELSDLDQSTVAILDQSTVAILDSKQTPLVLNQSTVAILDQGSGSSLGQTLPKAFGHGTMVAGLVHLIAPTARILPLKAFRADGSSQLANIVRAVYYAVDHGATVINMSFSFDSASTQLTNAIAYASQKGVICVASSGNDGKEKKVYPAANSKVIGVGSTNYSDKRSAFSNYGGFIRAAAPGEAVVTTYPGNNYAAVWGTSFSAPVVAGATAIMKQIDPKLNYDKLKDALDKGVEVDDGDIGDRLALTKSFQGCQQESSGSK